MKKCLFISLKAFGAGLAISLGSILNILSLTYIPNGKFVGSLLFPIGLMIVCFCSLNLYTGKIGSFFRIVNKKSFSLDLIIMLISNILISFLAGFIFYFIVNKNPNIMSTINGIFTKKTQANHFNVFIGSMFCGAFVYAAVYFFKKYKSPLTKAFGILVSIGLFVYMGYDHCIANSFYFAAANGLGNYQTYIALLLSIIGNSIGAIILDRMIG